MNNKEGTKWSKEETRYLKDNFYEKSLEEISEDLGRSLGALRAKSSQLGLSKPRGKYHYTPEIDMFIVDNYYTMTYAEMSEILGIPVSSISQRTAKHLKDQYGLREKDGSLSKDAYDHDKYLNAKSSDFSNESYEEMVNKGERYKELALAIVEQAIKDLIDSINFIEKMDKNSPYLDLQKAKIKMDESFFYTDNYKLFYNLDIDIIGACWEHCGANRSDYFNG